MFEHLKYSLQTEKSKELKEYPFLLPKCYDSIKVPRFLQTYSSTADVQILRSVSRWSSLINATEDSIQQVSFFLFADFSLFLTKTKSKDYPVLFIIN